MLSLTLKATPPQRKQLVLRLGAWSHACEQYYLAIDRGIAPGDSSPSKVRRVLVRLLTQWRDALAGAPAGTELFLPFDFADQATAWLRARVQEWGITVTPGWSAVVGWSFFPSDISPHVHSLLDFQPMEGVEPLSGPKGVWIGEVEASLTAARSGLASGGPMTDPTPIFEHFRGSYGSELLTAAVAYFQVFGLLAEEPLTMPDLRIRLGLAERPANVLVTALRAMELLDVDSRGRVRPTALALEHLTPGGPFDVGDYVGLAAQSPGVLEMVERLRSNRPRGSDGEGDGTAFIYREGTASAMDAAEASRHLTLALAGRAKNVAPHLAAAVPLDGAKRLLDVAGGTGLYALAFLAAHPELKAVVLDRPEVLKVAAEYRDKAGQTERLDLVPGDMFQDALPEADVVLLSNVLHDWDAPECRQLIARCSAALPSGGRLLIHDVFLDHDLGGPLPIALYSAALFTLTEGRAYSAAEYRSWLEEAGLTASGPTPTLVHCGVMWGTKP
jgi:predicted O-methyltransferase YrrM